MRALSRDAPGTCSAGGRVIPSANRERDPSRERKPRPPPHQADGGHGRGGRRARPRTRPPSSSSPATTGSTTRPATSSPSTRTSSRGWSASSSFLEDLKGKKEPPRAYSMASSPHEKYLAVTVKEERYVTGLTQYPPLLSPLLVKRIPRGHAAGGHRLHRALHPARRHRHRAPTTSSTSARAPAACPTSRS